MAAKTYNPTNAFHLTINDEGVVTVEVTDEDGDSVIVELDASQAAQVGADFLKKGLAAGIISM